MTINDLELEEHHRILRRKEGELDSLLREAKVVELADTYWLISRQALAARRRLRKICESR